METSDTISLYNPQGNVLLSERKTAATELMTCKAPEVVITGPAGTGKSLALMHRLNAVLMTYPGTRGLLLRKTRSALNESALVIFEEDVVPEGSPAYPNIRNTTRDNRRSYKYPNGSTLVVGGMDTPERVMSTQYDVIAVPEATELTEHDWELLTTRLRNWKIPTYQQIIADCNPSYPTHWLNKRMLDGKTLRLVSRHEDNPSLWDGANWTFKGSYYLDGLRRSTGVRYLRLFKGLWAATEGAVYPEFDPSVHVIKPFHIPKEWRRIRSTDFGFVHPFVTQWWAVDPDGAMYLYREIFYSKRVRAEHTDEINRLSEGESFEAHPADHDAEGRAALHKAGIRTQLAFKDVRAGIDAVTMRLRDRRIFFFRDEELDGVKYGRIERDLALREASLPTSTIEEFDSYVYQPTKDGRPGKEEPVKELDDGMDAMRYAVAHVDDIARKRFKLRGGRVGKAA
jgi:PBSX family phage terminase large subunit